MARQYNIRWSDKDERELKRVVKNFNAKVKRLEEKEPYLKDERPQKLSYKDIMEKFKNEKGAKGAALTRQDFNRQVNQLKRFQRRGAEEIKTTEGGVTSTKWKLKEASIMQSVVTRKRRTKRQNIESWQRQESESLFDKPKVDDVKPSGFENYYKSLEKEIAASYDLEKKQLYLENYISSTYENLGVYASDIVSYVKSIPLDSFVEASLTNPFLSIDFQYSESDQREKAEQILSEWQRVT